MFDAAVVNAEHSKGTTENMHHASKRVIDEENKSDSRDHRGY
jgi:hypothetical protein